MSPPTKLERGKFRESKSIGRMGKKAEAGRERDKYEEVRDDPTDERVGSRGGAEPSRGTEESRETRLKMFQFK